MSLTPRTCPKRTTLSSATLLSIALLIGFCTISQSSDLFAQSWRRKTPRDTIKVVATSDGWKASKLTLASGFQVIAKYKGTFGMYPGQAGKGIDAKYCYTAIPGWSTPIPLINPPTFNGRTDSFYLAVNRESPDLKPNGEQVKFIETTLQGNHEYSSLHTSLGIPLNYRITAKPKSFYGNGSGSLTVELAQWTAGISMRSTVLSFGNVNIGSSKELLDSIASYGVDPLLVDSVKIKGTGNQPSPDFTLISQRISPFTLPDEGANQFKITYAPSSRGQINAFLYVYCHNTDGANRIKVVQLSGYGVAPSLAIGPKLIDFGPVRVNGTDKRDVSISNGGNGVLEITTAIFTGDNVFTSSPAPTTTNTYKVAANSIGKITISFTPVALRKYRAVLTIKGLNVPQDSVILTGEGAKENLLVSDTLLNFGQVRRNDREFRSFTLTNTGTLAANILYCGLGGPNQAAYTLTPSATKFSIAPNDVMKFDVKFEPTTGPDGSRVAWVDITLDDGKPSRRVLLVGYEIEPKMLLGRDLVDFGFIKVGTTKWDTVSMYNNSNALLPFNDVTIKPDAGSMGTFGYDVNAKSAALKPNAYDSLRLSFTPNQRKQYGGWVHTNVNGQKDSIYMTGTGVLPIAVFEPAILDFGIVPTNWSTNLFTALSDTGDYKMEVCNVEVTGVDAAFFTVKTANPALPATIDPFSNKVNIPVEFKTNEAKGRTYHAWLKVIYCDGSADSIQMVAKEQAQMLEFGQRTVEFGKVRVKTSLTKPAILSNGSNTTLSVGELSINATPPYFSITQTSASVDKKSQGQVPVTFTPLAKGEWTGHLRATGADIMTDSILLKGTGAAPLPKFSDTVINFGTVAPPANQIENLIVENIGDWWMKARVSIENDEFGEFSLASVGVPFDSIGEGSQLTYPITFTPNTPQLIHTADLTFVLDDSSTYIVKLIGKDESQYISVDSQIINFGKVRIGQNRKAIAHIVNTWSATRTALDVSVQPVSTVITATPLGQIDVNSRSMKPIEVSFTPPAIGQYSATLIAKGGDVKGEDTVLITGIGADPKLKFAEDKLDFGTIVVGSGKTLPATISNEGNWMMHITNARLTGANPADFSFDIATDTTIDEANARTFNVNFLATTPLQATPRTAQIIFTLDDGKEYPLELIALDKAPVLTDIGFGEYYARPGDLIFAVMRLKTTIPAEISARKFQGTVEYDPTLIDLLTMEKTGLTAPSDWKLDTAITRTPGKIDFTLSSTSTELHDPGALLRIVFQAKKDLKQTTESQLRLSILNYLDTRELVAALNDGNIVIADSCGASQIIAGNGLPNGGSSIQQNHPNPFGAKIGNGQTEFLYDVARDDAIVTIRILDASGREVAKPVDNKLHAKGIYQMKLDAAQLGSGTYFYEFSVQGEKPTVRKMIISD